MDRISNKYQVVSEINSTPVKAVVIATGGGTGIFPLLLERGGGSGTLLAGMVPYAPEETISIMAGKPDKFVSEQTARSLAMAAYMKAVKLCTDDSPVIGLACTASLQTIPGAQERVGRKHQVFIALQTAWKTVAVTLVMNQFNGQNADTDINRRLWEEEQCVNAILNLLAEGCESKYYYEPTHPYNERFIRSEFESVQFGALLRKSSSTVTFPGKDGDPKIIFPGSFNPVHDAHLEMVSLIRNNPKIKDASKTVGFEISMFNVDKPPLDFITLHERIEQFQKLGETVIITNAPTFVEKSALFKNRSFIVGYDTAVRIMDPRYAGPIDKVLKTFRENGNYFYIFPRQHLESFSLPGEYITEKREFEHLSSSILRKEAKQ